MLLYFRSVFVLIWQTQACLNCCLPSFWQFLKTMVSLKALHPPTFIPVPTFFFPKEKKTHRFPSWLWPAHHLKSSCVEPSSAQACPHWEKPLGLNGLNELLLDPAFPTLSAAFSAVVTACPPPPSQPSLQYFPIFILCDSISLELLFLHLDISCLNLKISLCINFPWKWISLPIASARVLYQGPAHNSLMGFPTFLSY